VFNKIDTFSASGSFEAWVKKIVVNQCLQKIVSTKKQIFVSTDQEEFPDSIDDATLALETEMQEAIVMQCFNELPDHYRTILSLAVIEKYSHKEIGAFLHITENNSRILLLRAKQLLKNKLTGNE
jgi:RNA polymerase sigma factor (sigma-70 family)